MVRSEAEAWPLLILGGTFDPVHYGHLQTAWELKEAFGGEAELCFLPARGHRLKTSPQASESQRLAMLKRALPDDSGWRVDERELYREGLSRTYDTLEQFRQELGPTRPLAFVMGQDAWMDFPKWYRWLDIPSLAHIIVVTRPNAPSERDGQGGERLQITPADSVVELAASPSGKLAKVSLTQLDISSTRIRALFSNGRTPRFLLPTPVLEYIQAQGLYHRAPQ